MFNIQSGFLNAHPNLRHHNSPGLTGIGKYSGEMAEWLAAQGHEVRVVTAPCP